MTNPSTAMSSPAMTPFKRKSNQRKKWKRTTSMTLFKNLKTNRSPRSPFRRTLNNKTIKPKWSRTNWKFGKKFYNNKSSWINRYNCLNATSNKRNTPLNKFKEFSFWFFKISNTVLNVRTPFYSKTEPSRSISWSQWRLLNGTKINSSIWTPSLPHSTSISSVTSLGWKKPSWAGIPRHRFFRNNWRNKGFNIRWIRLSARLSEPLRILKRFYWRLKSNAAARLLAQTINRNSMPKSMTISSSSKNCWKSLLRKIKYLKKMRKRNCKTRTCDPFSSAECAISRKRWRMSTVRPARTENSVIISFLNCSTSWIPSRTSSCSQAETN